MPNDSRNTVAFVIIAGLMFVAYWFFVMQPMQARQAAERARTPAAAQQAPQAAPPPGAPGGRRMTLNEALAASGPRVRIDTPALEGSINLRGARFDDLRLRQYRVTVDANSPPVRLLQPSGTEFAYYVDNTWTGQNIPGLPDETTVWTAQPGAVLTPERPLTLTYRSPAGLQFTRVISVDRESMFTIADTVANFGSQSVTMAAHGSVRRENIPSTLAREHIVHEGAIGAFNGTLRLSPYNTWRGKGPQVRDSTGGWLGITDKYWMAALIPAQTEQIRGQYSVARNGEMVIYNTEYTAQAVTIPGGRQLTRTSHVFTGGKTVPLLQQYGRQFGLQNFDSAVDWGNFWFLTRPIFWLLDNFYRLVANFGIALLMVTVVVRLLIFPLANSGYEMGVKMRRVQPEMKAIQEKFREDPAQLQKESAALFAREKINPITGCIPMLLQIPIIYAVTKVMTVTIEMRHQPFFGWIEDLSARDPTTVLNLFGLIPWNPALTPYIGGLLDGYLHLGVWPLLYGFSLWLSQAMAPPTGIDPMQQRIFQFMPIIFTFVMAQYTVGLLIYWTWSSFITILQQYILMRRYKVENPIDDFIGRFRRQPAT